MSKPTKDQAESETQPRVHAVSEPLSVPVFNCIVYVARRESGEVQARVANLPDIAFSADSEPAALRLIVNEFKRRVAQCLAEECPIPWIEPPLEAASDEQKRLIPVHL